MDITDTDYLFISRSWELLSLTMHPSPGMCLAAHTALHFSTFQGSTWHPIVYIQGLQACSAYIPPVLPLLRPPADTHRSGDTIVLCHLLGRCQRSPTWHYFSVTYMGCECYTLGLSDPLKGTLCLHKCLWAIHMQSNPVS